MILPGDDLVATHHRIADFEDGDDICSGALKLRQLLELASRIWGTGREGFRKPNTRGLLAAR